MSGLFQRIPRRRADASDERANADAPAPVDGETTALHVDMPTQRMDPVEVPTTEEPTIAPAASAPHAAPASAEPAPPAAIPSRPSFRERGRLRRRLRYLRRLRELQLRDLGGLVFDLRRFGRKRDDLVAQKLDQLRACDDELHALEIALDERRELRDVHEPGIGGTCPRCFAIHGSTDRFCASCGVALRGAVQGPSRAPAPASPSGEDAPTS